VLELELDDIFQANWLKGWESGRTKVEIEESKKYIFVADAM
jgi:hypothetical protein